MEACDLSLTGDYSVSARPAPRSLPGDPEAAARLRRPRALRRLLAAALLRPASGLLAAARRAAGQLGVGHLQLGQRVADGRGVRAELGVDEPEERAGALDREPELLGVALVLGAGRQ